MKVVHEICAGIDVHARMLVVCLLLANGEKEIRTFSTKTDDLLRLRDWLVAARCTHVAIESTGVYWKPVFNILEDALTVRDGRRRQTPCRHVQRHGPRMIDGRRLREAHLADDLRPEVQRGARVAPLRQRKARPRHRRGR